jgi:hypothetical protein
MIDLNSPGNYLTVGWLQLSWANAIVIATMLALFAAALLLPFPGRRLSPAPAPNQRPDGDGAGVTS